MLPLFRAVVKFLLLVSFQSPMTDLLLLIIRLQKSLSSLIKASGSLWPLSNISIIPFKPFPCLRSYITAEFNTIWFSGEVPAEGKKHVRFLHTKRVVYRILQTSGQ